MCIIKESTEVVQLKIVALCLSVQAFTTSLFEQEKKRKSVLINESVKIIEICCLKMLTSERECSVFCFGCRTEMCEDIVGNYPG